jgi:transketolase
LHNCLAAAEQLATEGIAARVIDLYSIKPVDVDTLREACRDTQGLFVVAEDHYPEGGIAAAVLEALANDAQRPRISHCPVHGLPGSGTPADMLKAAGISAVDIASAARKLMQDGNDPH